jgi:glycerol uptake facilitator-like aquaporin
MLIAFIAGMIFYNMLSQSHPERFRSTSAVNMFFQTSEQYDTNNYVLLATIVGLFPLITTALGILWNLMSTDKDCLFKAKIEKERLHTEKKRELEVLDNIEGMAGELKSAIKRMFGVIGNFINSRGEMKNIIKEAELGAAAEYEAQLRKNMHAVTDRFPT